MDSRNRLRSDAASRAPSIWTPCSPWSASNTFLTRVWSPHPLNIAMAAEFVTKWWGRSTLNETGNCEVNLLKVAIVFSCVVF
jgi:hypothetical protein